MIKISRGIVPFVGMLSLAGCAILPNSGPSAGAFTSTSDVDIIKVTPTYAETLKRAVDKARTATVQAALDRLPLSEPPTRVRFAPGDTLHVDLLTISPWSGGTSSGGMNMTPDQINLGEYTVGPGGTITLPYAGRVRVSGLDVPQVQSVLSGRFSSLGIIQNPAVKVQAGAIPQGSVIVTGAIGSPKTIQWSPAGLTLAEALTMSLGNGTALLSSDGDRGDHRSATQVTIYRGDAPPVKLPMAVALEHVIPLEPGDRIIVTHAPSVKVTVLGAGIAKDGEYDYASPPTLAEVLAQASGLNDNVADDHAVFVLSRARGTAKPVVYDFAWNKVDGLVAAQDFPVENREIVYVAAAPIVPIEHAVDILFQLALPAQIIK
jgi:polysaccharide export outer membrane protein